jgi:hypothetical protein
VVYYPASDNTFRTPVSKDATFTARKQFGAKYSLVAHYKTSISRKIIKSLMALPFIPRMWIRQTFTVITTMDIVQLPAVTELLEYFCNTWLNGQHPFAMWNVYRQDTRTNNKLEGWHNSMNRAVKKSNPNTFELITTLKMEQSATDRTTRSARLKRNKFSRNLKRN